jgi:monoamine oxidase
MNYIFGMQNPNDLRRREFLKLVGGVGLLAACRPDQKAHLLQSESSLPELRGQGRTVAILGGGPAGLCAAYELDRMGFKVTILEKTKRVSGRVWTQYDFFEDGQYCEFGATRIPNCHNLTLDYAKSLGLELSPLDFGDETNFAYYIGGVRRFQKPGNDEQPWPEDRSRIDDQYKQLSFPLLGDPTNPSWPLGPQQMDSSLARDLDAIGFDDYLKQIGYSEFARQIIRAESGSGVDVKSALLWLAEDFLQKDWNTSYAIKGGNELLSRRLAGSLSPMSQLELMAEVKSVRSSGSKVTIGFTQKGEQKSLTVDYCISTLPLNVIKNVDWQGQMSKGKLLASAEVPMRPVTRVNLQFKTRFWEMAPYRMKGLKVLNSDLITERYWDMTAAEAQKMRTGVPTHKGILTAYMHTKNASYVGNMTPEERIKFVLDEVSRVFPEAKSEFIKGNSWVWHQQNWVGGAWASYAPNQLGHYLATLTKEGRVLFAGDHTTLSPGWIQGAFESAHRAIRELGEMINEDAFQSSVAQKMKP